MKRRSFLKMTGAAAVAVPVIDQVLASGTDAIDPTRLASSPDRKYLKATACDMCGAQDPIFVRVVDGRAVAVFANAGSSYTGGKICGKAHAGLEKANSPQRITRPMMRRGPGRYEPVSWDEAIDFMCKRLVNIANKYGENAVHAYMGLGSHSAIWKSLWKKTFGTKNVFGNDSVCDAGRRTGAALTCGDSRPLPDLQHTKVAAVFGADYLASTKYLWYPTQMLAALQGGARFYVIDPRFSETAARAVAYGGTWVPIKPGTDAALANAMAHVVFASPAKYASRVNPKLVRWDSAKGWFDGVNGFGVDRYAAAVKRMTPERAETITGVPVKLIRDMADDLMMSDAPLVDGWTGVSHYKNGTQGIRAVMCLAGLVNAFDRKGGLVRQTTAKLASIGCSPIPGATYRQEGHTAKLATACGMWPFVRSDVNPFVPEAILDPRFAVKEYERRRGKPPPQLYDYPVKALISATRNFANGNSGSGLWRKALNKLLDDPEGLVVDINLFITEQGAHSHLILPEVSFLERDDLFKPSSLYPTVHIRRALVPAKGESKTFYAMAKLIAAGLAKHGFKGGFDAKAVVPKNSYLEVMKHQASATQRDGSKIDWDELLQRGFWQADKAVPAYRDGGFGWSKLGKFTRTFDFYCASLAGETPPDSVMHPDVKVDGTKAKKAFDGFDFPRDRSAPGLVHATALPTFWKTPYHEPSSTFPLRLITCGRNQWNSASKTVHTSSSTEKEPENLLTIHPSDAKKSGVRDGDRVRVSAKTGAAIVTKVLVSEGIRPGVVHMANGYGQANTTHRLARGRGANVNELTDPKNVDPVAGAEGLAEMLVRVEAAS